MWLADVDEKSEVWKWKAEVLSQQSSCSNHAPESQEQTVNHRESRTCHLCCCEARLRLSGNESDKKRTVHMRSVILRFASRDCSSGTQTLQFS
jgi:hypothetical protein